MIFIIAHIPKALVICTQINRLHTARHPIMQDSLITIDKRRIIYIQSNLSDEGEKICDKVGPAVIVPRSTDLDIMMSKLVNREVTHTYIHTHIRYKLPVLVTPLDLEILSNQRVSIERKTIILPFSCTKRTCRIKINTVKVNMYSSLLSSASESRQSPTQSLQRFNVNMILTRNKKFEQPRGRGIKRYKSWNTNPSVFHATSADDAKD